MSDQVISRLLRAADAAKKEHSRSYVSIVQEIEEEHIKVGKKTIRDPEIIAQYVLEVQDECNDLVKILDSAMHLEEVSSRSENRILAKGEKLSILLTSAVLNDQGVNAVPVDLSTIIQDYNISNSRDRFYLELSEALGLEVSKCGDKVPVITGFFGSVPEGILALVGRGYSDLAASLVAVGVKAKELIIWKEVDGVL